MLKRLSARKSFESSLKRFDLSQQYYRHLLTGYLDSVFRLINCSSFAHYTTYASPYSSDPFHVGPAPFFPTSSDAIHSVYGFCSQAEPAFWSFFKLFV